MFQILNEKGEIRTDLEPKLSSDDLKDLFRLMLTTRMADSKALKLQRQGRMGTFAESLGHEACQVGSAYATSKEDWIFPYFRDLGTYVALGFPLRKWYLYWMGNEEGMNIPENFNLFTVTVPVGSQLPQAVGLGMAVNIKKDKIAVLSTFSDGATSEGDFHEALNMAGIFKTPNVFLCYNNQYAISLPRDKQTASKTLAQKAIAYGFNGILIDGNDVLAVYTVIKEALEKARTGKGPTLIEAYTYRRSNHTTSDDASKYRSEEEVLKWEKKDPIDRFRIHLRNKGIWSEEFENDLTKEAAGMIEREVREAEQTPAPSIEDLFIHTYATMPPKLKEQMEETKAEFDGEEP
ncbi:MAG: pyruvate dehydrogenase (acetyl-transferring) E1 component subunit alpha [Candidatus Aminicenantes bacterium]|nr:pyruvate dehydrogenase (acetyl-transferring) E1 component subunit alpha [Candidatus Aminicenantes bacterium]